MAPPTQPLVVYVDVDETLVRNYGTARIPMPTVIRHVRALYAQGALLYCWSSGGATYAQESAREVGLEDCFSGFLAKPQLLIDDQHVSSWRRLAHIHPNACDAQTVDEYQALRNSAR